MSTRKTRRQIIETAGAVALAGALGEATLPAAAQEDHRPVESVRGLPARLAFGSCGSQDKPQPVLRKGLERRPDLFIYLGDNIYGDTTDMDVLRAKYAKLGAKPEFQELRRNVPLLATWDDHDYGSNDAGKEYPKKEESRAIFLDFWREPADSPRRRHAGIYHAHRFRRNGRVLQVLLLDTRFFRDPVKRRTSGAPFKNDYEPDPDPNKTLLGAEQWKWLEARLRERADLRVICSSIQFGHEYNGWESWTNLPREQERMVDLIRSTRANGVVFISGDVHWGEVSRRDFPGCYPLFDVTASGITETWPKIEPNRYRVGEVVPENHFGMIEVDWMQRDPEVALQIINVEGAVRVRHPVSLSQLRF